MLTQAHQNQGVGANTVTASFNSPTATFVHKDKAANQTPTRRYEENQCQYEIVFPSGPMGLELEPVITSSERTIGCRVKDFYFGIDYDGIDRIFLQEHVQIGDIIITVNEVAVVSQPFPNILKLLRSLSGQSRTVVFKNITASWKTSYQAEHRQQPKISSLNPPVTTGGDSYDRNNTKISGNSAQSGKHVIVQGVMVDAENVVNHQNLRHQHPRHHPSSSSSSSSSSSTATPATSHGVGTGKVVLAVQHPAALKQLKEKQIIASEMTMDQRNERKKSVLSPKRLSPVPSATAAAAAAAAASSFGSSYPRGKKVASPHPPSYPHPQRQQQQQQQPRQGATGAGVGREGRAAGQTPNPGRSDATNEVVGVSSPLTPSGILRLKQKHRLRAVVAVDVDSSSSSNNKNNWTSGPSQQLQEQQENRGREVDTANTRTTTTANAAATSTMVTAEPLENRDLPDEGLRESVDDMSTTVLPPVSLAMTQELEQEVVVKEEEGEEFNNNNEEEAAAVSEESKLRLIVDRVKGSIGHGLVQVGSVLSVQAEKALVHTTELLPVYSNAEMKEVMGKKYDLLNELSQSCMLLGQAQEKEIAYAEQTAKLQELQETVAQLEAKLDASEVQKDGLQFKCKTFETELSVLKIERAQDQQANSALASKYESLQRQMEAQRAAAQETASKLVTAERTALQLDQELANKAHQYATDTDHLRLEKDRIYSDFEHLRHESQELIHQAERERDGALAELDVFREMSASDGQAAAAECARLREAMASQQFLHKERLVEADGRLHSTKRELQEAKEGIQAMNDMFAEEEKAKADLHAQLTRYQQDTKRLNTQLEEQMTALEQARQASSNHEKEIDELKQKLLDQETRVTTAGAEHGMLRDKVALTNLNNAALQTEIAMLKREIEQQKDELAHKDMNVMTATSKCQAMEDTIGELQTEIEKITTQHSETLQEKETELQDLEKSVCLLEEERDEQVRAREEIVQQQLNESQESIQQCEALQELIRTLDNEKKRLGQEHTTTREQLQVDLEAAATRCTELSEAVQDMRREKELLLSEHNEVIAQKIADAEALSKQVAALKQQITEIEDSHAANMQLRENELDKVKAKSSCIEETLSQARMEITTVTADCRRQMDRKDEELLALAERFEALEKQSSEATVQHAAALAEAKESFDQREKEFMTALSLAEDTQDSLRIDLHRQLSSTSEENAKQRNIVEKLQKQLEEEKGQHVISCKEASEQMDVLKTDLGTLQERYQQLEGTHAEMTKNLEQRNVLLDTARVELKASKECQQALESEVQLLRDGLAKEQLAFAAREESLVESKTKLQCQLEEESQQLASVCHRHTAEKHSFQTALQMLNLELVQLRSALNDTKTDFHGLAGVHHSIVRSLQSQQEELKSQLDVAMSRQPGAVQLEGRLSHLLHEKENASRRAIVAEQNTIEAEARCVNALTKAMHAEKSFKECSAELNETKKHLLKLEQESAVFQTEAQSLASAQSTSLQQIQDLEASIVDFEAQRDSHQAEIESLRAQVHEKETELETNKGIATEEMAGLWAQIESLKSEKEERERDASSVQAEQLLAQKAAEEAEAKAAEKYQLETAALQLQLDTSEQRRSSEEARYEQEMNSLRETLKSMVDSHRSERETLEAQYASLQKQLQVVEATSADGLADWKRRYESALEEHRNVGDVHRTEREQLISRYEKQLQNKQQECEALLEQVSSEQSGALESLTKAHAQQQEELRQQVLEWKHLKAGAEQQKITAEEDARQSQSALGEARARVEELQASLAAMTQETSLKQQAHETAVADALRAAEHAQRAVTDKEAECKRYQEKCQESQCREEEWKTAALAAEALVNSTQDKLRDLQAAHDSLAEELSDLKRGHLDVSEELNNKLDLVSTLEEALQRAESNIAANGDSVQIIAKDLEIAQERKKELKQQLSDSELKQRTAEQQCVSLRGQLAEMKTTLLAQQAALSVAESRESEYTSNRAKLEQIIAETELKYQQLKTEMELRSDSNTAKLQKGSQQEQEKYSKLQEELMAATCTAKVAQEQLAEKSSELQSLHKLVTDLVANTLSSPRKQQQQQQQQQQQEQELSSSRSGDEQEGVYRGQVQVQVPGVVGHDEDKENNILVERLPLSRDDSSAGDASSHFCIDATTESICEWQNHLIEHSIDVYELIIAAYRCAQSLQQQQQSTPAPAEAAAAFVEAFHGLCVKLSQQHTMLHELLVQSPWTPADHRVILTPAHELEVSMARSTAKPLHAGAAVAAVAGMGSSSTGSVGHTGGALSEKEASLYPSSGEFVPQNDLPSPSVSPVTTLDGTSPSTCTQQSTTSAIATVVSPVATTTAATTTHDASPNANVASGTASVHTLGHLCSSTVSMKNEFLQSEPSASSSSRSSGSGAQRAEDEDRVRYSTESIGTGTGMGMAGSSLDDLLSSLHSLHHVDHPSSSSSSSSSRASASPPNRESARVSLLQQEQQAHTVRTSIDGQTAVGNSGNTRSSSNSSSRRIGNLSRSIDIHMSPDRRLKSSAESIAIDALAQAAAVSAEIDDIKFDAFNDVSLQSTPPTIKRLLRAGASAAAATTAAAVVASGGDVSRALAAAAEQEAHNDSLDSVASDLFNISGDTVATAPDSDDEGSAVFRNMK